MVVVDQVANRLVAVLVAMLVSATSFGCSVIVHPKRSAAPAIIDTVVASAAGLLCMAALGTDAFGSNERSSIPASVLCIPTLPIALVVGLSASYGFRQVAPVRPRTSPDVDTSDDDGDTDEQ